MATALDTKLRPKALSIIASYGKDATIDQYAAPFYDPGSGENQRGDVTTTAIKIVPPQPYETRFVDGDTIIEGDMRTWVADLDVTPVEPKAGDELTLTTEGDDFKIVGVSPIYSGELVALWELHLRR